MSVPEIGQKPRSLAGNEKSFYGRSYPRATVVVGEESQNSKEKAMSAIAPLLDWAKKASWKDGGSNQRKAVAFPKAPFTPLYAFLAGRQLRLRRQNPQLSAAEVLVLAKADAAGEWENLSASEQELYVKMAQDDAQRYEEEVAAFKQKYPELWASRKETKLKGVKLQTRPKSAKTAWRLFLEDFVHKAIEAGTISEDTKGLYKQVEVMKEAAAAWKQLSETDKQPYQDRAEEEQKRYRTELEKFPVLKAELDAKATAKAESKRQKDAKKAIYEEVKPSSKSRASKTRPARKRALPKPKTIVKRGKFVGKGAEMLDGPTTRSKRSRAAKPVMEEDVREEDDSEAEESDVECDDDSDDDAESENESEVADVEEQEDTDQVEAEDIEEPLKDDDSEPDLSDVEDPEHADKENAPPKTIEKAMLTAEFVADTPAAQYAGSDEEQEDDDSLRAIDRPEDLVKSDAQQKDKGILSWARSALMSGFKGMWSRGSSQPSDDSFAPQVPEAAGASKKRKR